MKYLASLASISTDELYRYSLVRRWDVTLPFLGFCMLNPSKADAMKDDPTIKRCVGFARQFGYGGIWVSNICALRATDPGALLMADPAFDPVGPPNDIHIEMMSESCPKVVVAWGAFIEKDDFLVRRSGIVLELLRKRGPVYCLGQTKHGQPRHPLFLPKSAALEVF